MGSTSATVPLALALLAPAAWACVRKWGPRRGLLVALLGGWMFLPVFDGHLDLPYLASKMSFVGAVVLVMGAILEPAAWARLRPHPVDLVAFAVGAVPFATALDNALGPNEGASAALHAVTSWVAPYLLGRVHFGSPRAIRDYAVACVVAALVYVPLCLWEIRMSPELHRQLYGYAVFESFAFVMRFGGYRPTVFMQFGLMVGTFMATGTLVAYWLWRTGAVRTVAGQSMGACAVVLGVTTLLVKSTGAVILLFVGVGVLEATRRLRNTLPVLALLVLPVAFAGARIAGWKADEIVRLAEVVDADRARSVAFRIANEQLLMDKALERPWIGWGRMGRSRIYDEEGKDISVTDSLWIIQLGTTGIVGLVALGLLLLLPVLLLVRGFPARDWGGAALAPIAALAVSSVLWVVDCLLNAMTSPIFPAICGAATTLIATRWPVARRRAPANEVPRAIPLETGAR